MSQWQPQRVISSLGEVDAAWLSAVLRQSGALTGGGVVGHDVVEGQGNWSENARLRLHYSEGSTGERPQRLFLKLTNTDLGDDEYFGSSEVDYYARDYRDVPDAPVIRCYDAAYSAEKQRYHVLLDDLTDTHFVAANRRPTLAYGLALAEGLAALHARWWGGSRLTEAGVSLHTPEHIERFVEIAAPGAEHIIAALPAELAPHWPQILRDLFASHSAILSGRSQNPQGFTIIHGDVGENNILIPRAGERPIYIIDRQPFDWSLTIWLGVYDLAYAMVLDWDSETRRQLEMPVLKHYHAELARRGVAGYSWERLLDDYRLSVATTVCVATEYCRGGINERAKPYWLPMLRRALTACDDLDCRRLW